MDYVLARAGVLMIIALVAIPGVAIAQDAEFDVTLGGLPTAPVSVQAGQSASVPFDVTVRGEGFGCSADVQVPVVVDVSGAGQQATAAAPAMNITIAQGAYSSASPIGPITPYNETISGAVSVQTSSGVSSGYSLQLSLVATFQGGDYTEQGCVPGMLPSATSGSKSVTVNVQPDQAPTGDGGDGGSMGGDGGDGGSMGGDGGDGGSMGGDGGTGGDGGDDEGGGIPTPWALVPLALAFVALIARRRR